MDLLKDSVSRRSFLKGMAAVGAMGVVAGCGKDDGETVVMGGGGALPGALPPEDLSDLSTFDVAYASCPHNCGPANSRCISKIWTKNGRIVRVTSDDFEKDYNGTPFSRDDYNQAGIRRLSCVKGRSYKYRVYHTGRIKYPMKQTKERGDTSGFVRISWEQGYNEVMRKHWAIYEKYGPAAIQSGSNNSSVASLASAGTAVGPVTASAGARSSYGNHSFHQYMYAEWMAGVPGSMGWSPSAMGSQMQYVAAGKIKNWVSFGTNAMSTNSGLSFAYLAANQSAKKLNPNYKHYVIAPELSDTGVLTATDWVQIRNMTDAALIAGMINHMLVNTFDSNGNIMQSPMLDVNYIDTVLYGFFDSPEYWIATSGADVGKISLTEVAGYRKINAVPSGKSYASWIMGSDDRLTKANYSSGANYTAKAYGPMPRAGKCSWPVNGTPAYSADINSTKYYTKKNYMEPKTPEWAERITGTPAAVIRELAELYAKPDNHPIFTEWTGGLQKAENGVSTLFAMQTLFAVTKTWGYTYGSTGGMYVAYGGTVSRGGTIPSQPDLPDAPSIANAATLGYGRTGSANPTTPSMSCKEHFNGLYFAFKDKLDASEKFTGSSSPYWDGTTRYLNDDAGAKTQILYKRSGDANGYVPYTDADGRTYNDWVGRETNSPVYVGKRMYIGCSGTQFNQIANPNWQAEIFRALPLAQDNPDDAETFCMAVFEPYMSPQARFADYVFPMAGTLEVPDDSSIGGFPFARLALSTPPGEAKDAWDAAYTGWKARYDLFSASKTFTRQDGANPFTLTTPDDVHFRAIGETTRKKFVSVNDKYRTLLEEECAKPTSYYYGMKVSEAIGSQIRPKITQAAAEPSTVADWDFTTFRKNVNNYLSADMSEPFIKFANNYQFSPTIDNEGMGMNTMTTAAAAEIPGHHGRMTCYAEYAVKRWERAYDIHHGWLPQAQRGQSNIDYEGDPKLYPLPLYYHFEDGFNEMYGVFNPRGTSFTQSNWKLVGQKPQTNDISLIKDRLTLTVGSTHDRYRTHSSQAENPFLRELNHRIKGGGWASGNDWNEYCVVPEVHAIGGTSSFNPMLSSAIQKKNMKTASWHEFWMNDADAAQFGIKDGDLIRVSNPVGAIRVIARVTPRLVRGHGQIHQGAWYDPNPADGVDDGGCANTLMSNRGSKYDNGNAIHCAYCVIEKETSF